MRSKLDICDEANSRFKELIDENKNHYAEKFCHLPYWLDEVSYYFMRESDDKLPNNYYYFKRGSIIRVNFGVNEGSEFSNLHFAIVLDKKDSQYKRTLTVLPLTSKQKAGRYSLGKEVFNQTTTVLNRYINEQHIAVLKISDEREAYAKKVEEIDSHIHKLENKLKGFTKEIIDEKSKDTEIEDEYQKLLEEIKALQNSCELYEQLAQKINDELIQRNNKISELEKVVSIYQKYNKNSYVRLSDITTISKLRIERINKFDPSGKIRLTSDQMKGISDQLMKLYISN